MKSTGHPPWIDLEGPWQGEPEGLTWTEEETGYLCVLRRGPMGAWCGYAQVPHGVDDRKVDVHGCVTWGRDCLPNGTYKDATKGWIGFDCSHAGDVSPMLLAYGVDYVDVPGYHETYRTFAYAKAETERMARSAHAILKK